jgi:hypothetical protein
LYWRRYHGTAAAAAAASAVAAAAALAGEATWGALVLVEVGVAVATAVLRRRKVRCIVAQMVGEGKVV